ncbi:MAG: ABC transporter permease [Terrisporobacter sp.]
MINYLKSEVYRNIRNKGNYIFLLGCIAFVIFLNIVLSMFLKSDHNFPYATTKFSFSSLYSSMAAPIILCVPLVSIVFGQELKNHTLKNTISYGIPRNQIYLVKFIMILLISLINLILVSGVHIISGYLLLQDSGVFYLNELIRALIACIPLFLVSVSLAHCLYFTSNNENSVMVWWVIIMIVIPTLLAMLGNRIAILGTISEWMPWNIVGNITQGEGTHSLMMYWCTQKGLINCFIAGIVGTLIFYIFGMKKFEKLEIK